MIRYEHDEASGTFWPVDVERDASASIEWLMRYASSDMVLNARFQAASLISAYTALVDPTITQAEAIDKLKRARRCAAEAWKESE